MSDLAIAFQINSAIGNTPAKSRLIRSQVSGNVDIGANFAAQAGTAEQPLKSLSRPMSVIFDSSPRIFPPYPQSFEEFLVEGHSVNYYKKLSELIKLHIKDPQMKEKLLTGLTVGLMFVLKALLTLPKLMKQSNLPLDAQTFIDRAKKTFDFIDELTQLSVDNISDVEMFMTKGDIPRYGIDTLSKRLKKLCALSVIEPKQLESLMEKMTAHAEATRDQFKEDPQLDFMSHLFEFTNDGRMTLTQKAIETIGRRLNEEFADYRDLVVALPALAFPNLPVLKHAYYGCPARVVPIEIMDKETGHKKIINLIQALHLSFMKILESIPTRTLDHYIRTAA